MKLSQGDIDALVEAVAKVMLNNARIADYLLVQQTALLERLVTLVAALNVAPDPGESLDAAAAVEATDALLKRIAR